MPQSRIYHCIVVVRYHHIIPHLNILKILFFDFWKAMDLSNKILLALHFISCSYVRIIQLIPPFVLI